MTTARLIYHPVSRAGRPCADSNTSRFRLALRAGGLAACCLTAGVLAAGANAQPAARPMTDNTLGLKVAPLTPPKELKGRNGAPLEGEPDPVVATVEGLPIYLSDVGRASQALPENLRTMPFEALYPVLLDRMIDHQSLVIMAKRRGMEDSPVVQREIKAATDRVLEGALLSRDAVPQVTEQAIQDRYNRNFANRPATEEVRARHILVATQDEANKVIADLKAGADFATLARKASKDPDGQKGGDLGFFRRDQVWPGFADVTFALQPGQVATVPVRNEFGWHVIRVEERRVIAPPSLSEVREVIRQELLAEAVQQLVAKARSNLAIRRYNLNGGELEAPAQAPAPR